MEYNFNQLMWKSVEGTEEIDFGKYSTLRYKGG